MTYETLAERNTTEGLQTIFVYVNDVTGGIFIPMMLFAIFIVVALGSYFSAERLRGRGDFPASFAVAGFITTGAAFIMSLIDGLVNPLVLLIVVAVSVLSTLWLFVSNRE